MKPVEIMFVPETGDILYLYRRANPTPDGNLHHRGGINAGDYAALDAGFTYSDDKIPDLTPGVPIVPMLMKVGTFPEYIKKGIAAFWESDEVKELITARDTKLAAEAEQCRAAALAQAAAVEAAAKEEAERAEAAEKVRRKEFAEAVQLAVAEHLEKQTGAMIGESEEDAPTKKSKKTT